MDLDLETDVWQCQNCGYVTADAIDTCPVCGMRVQRTALPQVLPVLARRNGARIELVSGDAATRLPGGIGALLRYVSREE